jgi:hypothetical protein
MHESEQERELAAWEARLSAFRPGPSRLERDRVMYLAGQASVNREGTDTARRGTPWTWPTALAGMTAVAGFLLVALVVEHRGDTVPPAPDGSGAVAKDSPSVPVQNRDGAPGDRDHPEVLAAERKRVVWPVVGEPERLTVRSPRWDEADRMSPQLAELRVLKPAGEGARPPGSFGPPLGPDPPRRPRSYVERRRMLLEELECLGETSAQGPFRHPPTGV